jgi:hypothetical protein
MPDGTTYLFGFEADDTWTVWRDGRSIASGPGGSRGIGRGTRLFVSLTRTEPGSPLFRDSLGTPPSADASDHA